MPKFIKVYEWKEIQKMLCEAMGIDEKYFRNYHSLVGSDQYMDFWHVLVDGDPNIGNDKIVQMYYWEGYTEEDFSEEDKWQYKLVEAMEKVFAVIDPDYEGVWVHYCW